MNKSLIQWTLILSFFLLTGCGDNSTNTNPSPEITSISPTMGPTGITVSISGSGFSTTPSQNNVTFNGTLADISSASETAIEATVPKGARTGAVEVTTGGQIAVGPNFTVEEAMPGITSIEPDSGTVGTQVTITGMNFSPTPEENIITFNGGVISTVQQASETELIIEVPEGAESGPIQIEVNGEKTLSPSFDLISTGTLEAIISIDATGLSEDDIDPNGYVLEVDDLDGIGTSLIDTVYVSELGKGRHHAELNDIIANCRVMGNNPIQFDILAGDTTQTSFEVICEKVSQQFLFISNRTYYEQIYTMDMECCDPPVNLTDDRFGKEDMVISPDNNLVAYEAIDDFSNIYIAKTDDSSSPTQLTTLGGEDPSFSPDGSKIAYGGPDGITVVDTEGSGSPVYLTSSSLGGVDPSWSNDGTQIAFEANTSIYVVNSDGSSSPDSLTEGYDPAWSPAGDQIVYWGFDSDDSEIFLIDANGSGSPTKLTDNTAIPEGNPSWSPDGTTIAFERDNSGVFDIFLVNSDGSGSPQNLTNDPRDNRNPVWAPDGNQIMFEMIDGKSDIYLINIDGTNLTQLTNHAERDDDPVWGGMQ